MFTEILKFFKIYFDKTASLKIFPNSINDNQILYFIDEATYIFTIKYNYFVYFIDFNWNMV